MRTLYKQLFIKLNATDKVLNKDILLFWQISTNFYTILIVNFQSFRQVSSLE